MLKTRVRVESKSHEDNNLLMPVGYCFPLKIALESRIAHRLACRVLPIGTYRLAYGVLVIDTHRLVCRVLAIVSHSTRELVLSCICGLWSSLTYIYFNPFMAVTAIRRFEVTTHMAICLTLADKYF